ncbi:Manganese/iron superoxide dismutase [Lentinula edodes]|nr:Manganese/iron superoxide dismutase [Lentinula edodes]
MHRSPVVLVGRRIQNTLSRFPSTSTSTLPLPPPLTPPTTRALHTPKPLPYDPALGLGDFLPPPALHVVAVEYQKGLLDRLNEEVRGTEMSDMSVMQTIVSAATDRTRVLAFNYASLALNNHFFLDNLKPPTPPYASHQHLISPTLSAEIRAQHGSLAQLKSSFSAAATGLFTSGYVWFVTDAAGNTGVVPTFGPGSVLVRSQMYMGYLKGLGGRESGVPGGGGGGGKGRPDVGVGAVQSLTLTATAGDTLYPLFCLSVHEHAWLSAGYGVWGKERWVRGFWDVVDWGKVSRAYEYFRVR